MALLKAILSSDYSFDSSKIDIYVSLAHRIDTYGTHSCAVLGDNGKTCHFQITVESSSHGAPVIIDCDELFSTSPNIRDISLSPEDYLMFVSMNGDGRYEVQITANQSPSLVIFDSKSIGINSVISISPYVPGAYEIFEQNSGAASTLVVRPLEDLFGNAMSEEAISYYQALQEEGALNVTVTGNVFSPDPIVLDADRPMAIQGVGPLRIVGRMLVAHSLAPST